ncbi:MAG: hypothetical protein ACK5MR_03900 [Cumulibacter sp.]
MTEPGDRPRVVRRTRRSTSPSTATEKRRDPSPPPPLGIGMYTAPTTGGSRGLALLRLAGALALAGAILTVVADFLPYVSLAGEQVTAGQDIASILAHIVVLVMCAGGGVLMLAGRGGRVGPALIAPFAMIAPGTLLQHIFAGALQVNHDGEEYYFGNLYTTLTIEPHIGRALAIVGAVALIAAGLASAGAWSDIAERDLLPLGSARGIAGGAAGITALLAVTALLVPAATPRIDKYTNAAGMVLTREIAEPHSAITSSSVAFVGGILLLIGWVLIAALVGAMTSRVTVVAALLGAGAVGLWQALLNLRDIIEGPDLVSGPRLYLLLGAAVVALGAAGYAARVRAEQY